MSLNGLRVHIVKPVQSEIVVRRTWAERLLSTPWRPTKKYTSKFVITEAIKDSEIIKTENGLFMNEKTWQACKLAIKD